MKKYYVFDNNGKYLSADGETRFSLLQGKALKEYFTSNKCIGKRFMKLKPENPGDDEIYIELMPEHIKAYRVSERHEQYVSDTEEEYCPDDVLSLDAPISDSEDDLTLADVIADPDADVEADFAKQMDIKTLRKALKSLSSDDLVLIQALYLLDTPKTEKEYADELGVAQPTIHKKKVRILKCLKNYFEK